MDNALNVGLKRTAELSAIFMIGNGVVGLLAPAEHLELWRSDVAAVDRFTHADARRSPAQRRNVALLQVGAGAMLAAALLKTRLFGAARQSPR